MLKLRTHRSKGLVIAASLLIAAVVVQADTDDSIEVPDDFQAIMGIDTEEGGFYYAERVWLGCAVDAAQCATRATDGNFAWYAADRSSKCPSAAKFGCWGY